MSFRKWVGKSIAWVLLRDGEFYIAYPTRRRAREAQARLSHSSLCQWTIRRAVMTERAKP